MHGSEIASSLVANAAASEPHFFVWCLRGRLDEAALVITFFGLSPNDMGWDNGRNWPVPQGCGDQNDDGKDVNESWECLFQEIFNLTA